MHCSARPTASSCSNRYWSLLTSDRRVSMRVLATLGICLAVAAGTVSAQTVVDPGMSREQVIAKLGKPDVERAADGSVFLFYKNGVERRVGMSDIVVLTDDKVVDAVFR